jgi:hypothetical protein
LDSDCLRRNNLIVMSTRLNNVFFRLNGASYRGGSIYTAPSFLGQIYRVVNTGGTTDSLTYTKIDGSTASTGNLTNTQITYVLALSGSLSDSTGVGSGGQLTVTNLLITSSVDETPTFTEQVITTTGAGTFTKPLGVTQVIVECWGAGGAGGGSSVNDTGGGGGGGGQYSRKYLTYTSPSIGISYSVGAGGIGSTGNGTNGGDATWDTSTVIGKGGGGGGANNGSGGETNTLDGVGDVKYFGVTGESGFFNPPNSVIGGAGGSAASSTSTTTLFILDPEYGGFGASQIFVNSGGSDGNPGNLYGAGGGGAAKISGPNRSGGAGAQGLIRIIYR